MRRDRQAAREASRGGTRREDSRGSSARTTFAETGLQRKYQVWAVSIGLAFGIIASDFACILSNERGAATLARIAGLLDIAVQSAVFAGLVFPRLRNGPLVAAFVPLVGVLVADTVVREIQGKDPFGLQIGSAVLLMTSALFAGSAARCGEKEAAKKLQAALEE